MPTKNVTDERLSKFKNKGKDPAVSWWGLIFKVTRVYTLIESACWPLAETEREKDLRVRGAAQSSQEWKFPEEEKYNAVVSPGWGRPLAWLRLQRDGQFTETCNDFAQTSGAFNGVSVI